MGSVSRAALGLVVAGLLGGAVAPSVADGPTSFGTPVKLAGLRSGFSEPRLAIGPDGSRWVITNDPSTGHAIVLSSADGRAWRRTPAEIPGQQQPTPDTDIVVTRTGRVIATELDGAGLSFVTAYSDDRGRSWTAVHGTSIPDTDRPWLAVGPDDVSTHQPRVYVFWHNLVTGAAQHLMSVQTSTDGGASFGPPVPVALPGSQAYLDLQCADSGAPSSLVVDGRSGQIYAVFGTRTSALGGCGASVTGEPEANVVGETRIWVATSPNGALGSWSDHLAADAGNKVVSASFETSALDRAGNLYVAYAQTAKPYPDFSLAAVRYVWARPGALRWSAPHVVAPGAPIGHYDPTVTAGDRGRIAIAYYEGTPRAGRTPVWSVRAAVLTGADTPRPRASFAAVDLRPAYAQSADAMGGACSTGPLAGLQNGFLCRRAADDWALGLDRQCHLLAVYPMVSNDGRGSAPGTWATAQSGAPTLCASDTGPPPTRGAPSVAAPDRLPATGLPMAPGLLATAALVLSLWWGGRHTRGGAGPERKPGGV